MGAMINWNVKAMTVENQIDQFIGYDTRPEKIAYLTFDDGPSIYSSELLDILVGYEVPAIFFVTGESLENMPKAHESLIRMLDEGHYVGLHSMSHDRTKLYMRPNSPQLFVQEMLELKELIFEITGGFETNLCRAPYGAQLYFRKEHWEAVEESGLYCIDWNVDSKDWSHNSVEAIFNQIENELNHEELPDTMVLLFHENPIAVQALPKLIEYIKDLGYTFVPYIEGEIIDY